MRRDDEERARKKQKLSNGTGIDSEGLPDTTCRELLVDNSNPRHAFMQKMLMEEFDLEISLRQRIAGTIESKIALAIFLHDLLLGSAPANGNNISYSFRDIAREALHDIEAPLDVIFNKEINIFPLADPKMLLNLIPQSASTQSPSQTSAQSSTRSHRLRDRAISQMHTPGAKLLFICDNSTSPPVVAKMACPDCSRGDFTNIQGLLNHCRIRHSKDYGSHDECMQQCAVLVEEEDRDWVLRNGTELSGVSLPSLRRLFEIAVGNVAVTIPRSAEEANHTKEEVESSRVESEAPNHLSRTLGHHKDTPALAPFLGRTPRRRCINVHHEDEYVDVGAQAFDVQVKPSWTTWRMLYAPRNDTRSCFDVIANPDLPCKSNSSVPTSLTSLPDSVNSNGTRFHILARIVVSDRSLWLTPGHRDLSCPADHTHRWMLSIDSTSYSIHITTFLTKATMACLTDPPPSTLLNSQTITAPPFTFVGTTDKPFLACLTLEWAGAHNPPMHVQHWVELDLSKATHPVLGDEQVLDVELDRNTELLPVLLDYDTLSWENNVSSNESKPDDKLPTSTPKTEPPYITTLKRLLPLAPLTMNDVKGRPPSQLSYKLVSNPAQFRALVLGRRKAIEWARAKALLAEYEKDVKSSQSETVPLKTADIYRWMVDEGLFIRDTPKNPSKSVPGGPHKNSQTDKFDDFRSLTFCLDCGLQHGHTIQRESVTDLSDCPYVCYRLKRLPMMNLGRILSGHSASPTPKRETIIPVLSEKTLQHDLVAISDPGLTLAVRDVVASLRLGTFRSAQGQQSIFPLTELGTNTAQIDSHMAPFAVLSFATRAFLGILVKSSLNVAHQDWSINDERSKTGFRILTPSHVVRGVYDAAHSEMLTILSCCLRFGLPLGHNALENVGRGE